MPLTPQLRQLEAEAIFILREVVAEFERPVMLYSIGKDSSVMLHLALKAFYPAKPPFPLLHVDTTWKFKEMIAFRDIAAKKAGMELIVHINQDGVRRGISPVASGSAVHTQVMKTEGLRQALDAGRYDVAFGGARRDEEKSRAKERIFSHRSAAHAWDPRNQRPELWRLFNTRIRQGESMRVFPLSNWTEFDVWDYIAAEAIDVVPLYFAKPPAGRRARRIVADGRRRSPAAAARRGADHGARALPHAGLLPADRRGAVGGGRPRGGDRGDALLHRLRARGPAHRQRRVRLDGKEETRRVFLMTSASAERAIAAAPEEALRPALRFLTCGSVDDGKSTLIGRLLYEQNLVYDDQLAALTRDTVKHGTTGETIDFALLVDGLEAERQQGITIDVAYRYFKTKRRGFIVADTPGHEQYTRNMATGASNADLAILLVDARKGLLTQTHRHATIVSMLGIKHVVLAINKIDLVGFSQTVFDEIEAAFRRFAQKLAFADITAIPLSARDGDNLSTSSARTPWYRGPALVAASRERRHRRPSRGGRPSACRCNGSTGRISISAASAAPSPAVASRRATPSSSPHPGALRRWRASSPPTAISRPPRPAMR